MSQFKFCPQCGGEVAGERNFCGKCGAPVITQAAPQPQPIPQQQIYQPMPMQQQAYQQPPMHQQPVYAPPPVPAAVQPDTKLKPLPVIFAGLGAVALFLPFIDIKVPIMGTLGSISMFAAIASAPGNIMLILPALGIAAALLFCFIRVSSLIKVIAAAAALVPVIYYGFMDKVAFVALMVDSSGDLGDIASRAISYLDGRSGGLASNIVNQILSVGMGGMLLIVAMAVYMVLAFMDGKKAK